MKNKYIINRLVIIASLFLFSILLSCKNDNEQETVPLVFPFFNKIYAYQPGGCAPEVIHTSQYFFTQYFYQSGNSCLVSGQIPGTREKNLLVYNVKKGTMTTFLSGRYMHIIPLNEMAFTISSSYSPGRGFSYTFYRFSGKKYQEKVMYSLSLDLFISDVEGLPGAVVIAGADRNNTDHSVYFIDPINKKNQLLFTCPKKKDFMKIVKTDQILAFYLSCQDWKEQEYFSVWEYQSRDLELKQTDYIIGPPQERVVRDFPGMYSPFGKGFGENETLYIPVIDRQYNCGVLKLNEPGSMTDIHFVTIPVSPYFTLPSDALSGPGYHYATGYNYYKEKDKFYFLRFSKEISGETFRDMEQFLLE